MFTVSGGSATMFRVRPPELRMAMPEGAAAASAGPGPISEVLLLGGITLFLFPLSWTLRTIFGLDASEDAVDFLAYHAAYFVNNPHFAVTYLLFYQDVGRRLRDPSFSVAQRLRFATAGFLVPLGLALGTTSALLRGSAETMGNLIQLMFLLVGWHYVKQGFGVLAVFSGRRGFVFRPWERRALLLHCFMAWAYAWASPADPGRQLQEKGVVYWSWPHPAGLEGVTLVLFGLSALALIGVFAAGWARERRLPPLGPSLVFVVTIWFWTVYSSIDPLMVYVIPALHSLQYLYVVWLLRRHQRTEHKN